MTETREGTDVVERLTFTTRHVGDITMLDFRQGGCRPASDVEIECLAEITRLRAENERLLASMRIVRNELAALVPVPSADEPQWPEFFSAADYQCLTLALREARAAVELSKEPSNG